MTIKQVLKQYPSAEAELLLAHVLKQDKEFLWLEPNYQLSASQQRKMDTLMKKATKEYPVAYLLGYKYFYGLKFTVSPAVLIPRPESEWLIDKAVAITKKSRKTKLNILDAGTGSGCLAIALAKTIAKTHQITGVDISSKALTVAKANAKALGAKVKFLQFDVTKPFSKTKFDLVIANLPYVPKSEYKKYQAGLKYEPKLAITDNSETGELLQQFLVAISKQVNKGASVLLEIDPLLVKPLKAVIKNLANIKSAKFYQDLQHLDRYAIIQMK